MTNKTPLTLEALSTVQDDHDDGHEDDDRKSDDEPAIEIAKKEQAAVWRLRLLVIAVLACVAITVCLVVYFQGRKAEEDDFKQDFEDLGTKLVTSFEDNVKQRFGIIENFSIDISAEANRNSKADALAHPTNTSAWPFVTPSDWTHRARSVCKLASISRIVLMPRVTVQQRDEWEAYSNANTDWIAEGVSILSGTPKEEVILEEPMKFPVISALLDGPPQPDKGPGPYYPLWTSYPTYPGTKFNLNLRTDEAHRAAIDSAYLTGMPALEQAYDYWAEDVERDGLYDVLVGSTEIDYQGDPFTMAMFPVFETLNGKDNVVALLHTFEYWRSYFNGLLPPGSDGIVVILENTCDQKFTYQVDGEESRFLGHGDLHDPKYSNLQIGTNLDSILDFDHQDSAAQDQENQACRYSIRVYPSQEFEDNYNTDGPWIYAVIIGSLFIFTTAVFVLYDCMVEKRQKAVMKAAQQTGKIVHSLFPEVVRDQLYDEQETKPQGWENIQGYGIDGSEKKKAIASLYSETTVFFADLAGFTKWSSSRTPVEVFELLEALYSAFDDIAKRRKVYKIETIGDCYVAVTGLPDPQPDHAERMCKFAKDCMDKMHVVTASLAEKLGQDTLELAMRVGLHSGSVTAGVLRGQKSRFQLFGDTVNTASRMESNGVKGRIHVSSETADVLTVRGKATWLTPREDKIVAKGKGEMQTYFVHLHGAGTKSITTSNSGMSSSSKFDDTMPSRPSEAAC